MRTGRAAGIVGVALAALFAAACSRDPQAPAPPPLPPVAALPVGAASAPPAGATSLAEVAQKADGQRVVVVGYVWLRRPSCPPCPPGRNCEPCPPPYWQFSEKAHGDGFGGDPGAVVLADFASEPDLDVKTKYVLEGTLRGGSGQRVIFVDRIARLSAAAP